MFADAHGRCVHLFERDCSVQRRHQKILEEAPAPGMSAERRTRMGAAAVAAARTIGYVGAGTVEFIAPADVADGSFYFMEMNTRLQVEHPVTEMVTGLDLVEWQLRVASGEPLPLAQDQIALDGHAIEARIYAEDPDRDFLPSIGRIAHLRTPAPTADVRIDSGVRADDQITRYYDPMIGKLIVRGQDRGEALRRLADALSAWQVVGVATNIAFLQRVVAHPAYARGDVDTGLIAAHRDALLPRAVAPSDRVLAAAALGELERLRDAATQRAARSADRSSPWDAIGTWWLNSDRHAIALTFSAGGHSFPVELRLVPGGVRLTLGERTIDAHIAREGDRLHVRLGDATFPAAVVAHGDERHVFCDATVTRLTLVDRLAAPEEEAPRGG
ncbi:MAG TPA: 3-methylcrotonyl-CoA carboxylase, partial [Caldimonas sp.]|nr:3-methylcrotonyl-CoA carboxylase [Caldimonas sp.]